MRITGDLRVPGDKSISHRALMLSALASGASCVRDALPSADVRSTAGVLRTLGVPVPAMSPEMRIAGVGRRGLRAPGADLDCGNSGTTTRLMAGVVAGHPVTARFVGDASLSRRPMRRVAEPLTAMGALVESEHGEGLPLRVTGGDLRPIEWRSRVASAQVKSAVLLAAVVAGVPALVREPLASRDHTERMLQAQGVRVTTLHDGVSVEPTETLAPLDVRVPADPSSAAFFAALAAGATAGEIRLRDVAVNVGRTGFLDLLRGMGAEVRLEDRRVEGGEPVATVVVAPAALRGASVSPETVPSLIDELPLAACLAALADGETRVTGAGELRVKESDRIAAVVSNLRNVGVEAEELPDGFVVQGGGRERRLAGRIETHADHRLAMSFGVLGALTGGRIEVDDPRCVDVSFPGFWAMLTAVLHP